MFSAIINARTAVIVAVIGLGVFLLRSKYPLTSKLLILVGLPIIVLAAVKWGLPWLDNNSHVTYKWIINGFNEINAFINGESMEHSYFNYVSDANRLTLPEGSGLIFGKGYQLLGNKNVNISSDIGYVNDIWLGGIVYCAITYTIFLRYMISIIKSKNTNINFVGYYLLATFWILNIKGPIYKMNGLTALLVVLFVFVSDPKKQHE